MAANGTGRNAGQRVDLAFVILGKRQHVRRSRHAFDNNLFHGPFSICALGADEDLTVHRGERLGPIAEDVFAGPCSVRTSIDVTTGDGNAHAAPIKAVEGT